MTERMPMFPLGSVLVPHMLLPLRVFEPRYRQLLDDVGERGEFGVVLIERGFEVGGGDVRFDVGCVAKIIDQTPLDGGHVLVVSAGTERLRVVDWLADDPYPQAMVERLSDVPPSEPVDEDLADLATLLTQSVALMAELGYGVERDLPELADDPIIAAYQGMMLAPLAALDRQKLLALDDATERLRSVVAHVHGQNQLLESQLAAG